MKLRFFKKKVKPPQDFTTIEVEVNGVAYGYIVNWFKREGDSITEVKISDLPQSLLDYRADDIMLSVRKDIGDMLNDLKDSLNTRIQKINELTKDLHIEKAD